MKKDDLEILVAAPTKGGGKGMPPPKPGPVKKPADDSDDTVERTYLRQALEAAIQNDDLDAAVTSLIEGIRQCVQKELDAEY